MKERKKLGA